MATIRQHAFVVLALAATAAYPGESSTYSILSGGEVVGAIKLESDANRTRIDYYVDNNGRGPSWREDLQLDARGLPSRWTIDGRSALGAVVRDSYTREGAAASWESANDRGSTTHAQDALYVPGDTSPWAFGLFARAALREDNGRIATLPAGEIRVETLEVEVMGHGGSTRALQPVALWGMGLTPEILLLDAQQELVARFGAFETTLRDDFLDERQAITALGARLNSQYAAEFARRFRRPIAGRLQIENVRVFDSATGTLGPLTSVIVDRDVISKVGDGSGPVEASARIDAQGGTLLPGLFDMHAHLGSSWSALLHAAAGVTTVRDAGNDNVKLPGLMRSIAQGELIGPRILAAGFIEGRSPYSVRNGFVVATLEEALECVRWYAEHDFIAIKIYNSVEPSWVRPIATEAHRLGLHVMGHVPAFMDARGVIEAGYDEINHMNQLMLGFIIDAQTEDTRTTLRLTAIGERLGALDLSGEPVQALVKLMRDRGVAIDPTLAYMQQVLLSAPGEVAPNDRAWLANMPHSVQRQRMKGNSARPADRADAYRAAWRRMAQMVGMLESAGVTILAGSDDTPGFMLHSELEAYQEAGLPMGRVLQIATIDAARHLGIENEVGSIDVGKRAELLLLQGNPLEGAGGTRRVRAVITNGAAYFPEEIHRALGIEPFADTPPYSGLATVGGET